MSLTLEDYIWIARLHKKPEERQSYVLSHFPEYDVSEGSYIYNSLFELPYPKIWNSDLAAYIVWENEKPEPNIHKRFKTREEALRRSPPTASVLDVPLTELDGPTSPPWHLFWKTTKPQPIHVKTTESKATNTPCTEEVESSNVTQTKENADDQGVVENSDTTIETVNTLAPPVQEAEPVNTPPPIQESEPINTPPPIQEAEPVNTSSPIQESEPINTPPSV